MKNVLNFLGQSVLTTINLGVVSIASVAEATTIATDHGQAGIGLAKDKLRRKLVPSNVKNQAFLELSYSDRLNNLNDERSDRFDVYSGDMTYQEYRTDRATRIANMDYFADIVEDIKEDVESNLASA